MSETVKTDYFFTDSVMIDLHSAVVAQFGELPPIQPAQPTEYFGKLAESIVSQQLSTKVADIITARVIKTIGGSWDPQIVLLIDTEKFRAAGLSYSKAAYIKNIAQAWVTKKINASELYTLSDEEIIEHLSQIKGVGRWTAEMFLLFTLGRPDIFSMGDYGLRKAIINTYKLDTAIKQNELAQFSLQWQPHRSLASRILWKSLELK